MGDEILYGTYRPVRHELSGRYVPYGSAEYRLKKIKVLRSLDSSTMENENLCNLENM